MCLIPFKRYFLIVQPHRDEALSILVVPLFLPKYTPTQCTLLRSPIPANELPRQTDASTASILIQNLIDYRFIHKHMTFLLTFCCLVVVSPLTTSRLNLFLFYIWKLFWTAHIVRNFSWQIGPQTIYEPNAITTTLFSVRL